MKADGFSRAGVLVCFGFCNKILQTGWLINYRNFFLTVLEARSLKSGCQHCWVMTFWVADFSLCLTRGNR